MSMDNGIMLCIGLITLCLSVMIVWDISTRDSFTYDESQDDEQAPR